MVRPLVGEVDRDGSWDDVLRTLNHWQAAGRLGLDVLTYQEVSVARVFVGHDWAEDHHDVFLEDERGNRLAAARLPEGLEGVGRSMSSWRCTRTSRRTC
jgi:hypothetical protein